MNISVSSLKKKHFPVMLEEVIQTCLPANKNQLIIDCTFGGGGYSKELLKFPNTKIIALDRDKSAISRASYLVKDFPVKFSFYNEKFSNLDKIINTRFDNLSFHVHAPELFEKDHVIDLASRNKKYRVR